MILVKVMRILEFQVYRGKRLLEQSGFLDG